MGSIQESFAHGSVTLKEDKNIPNGNDNQKNI